MSDVVTIGIVGGGRTGMRLYETLRKYPFVKIMGIADNSRNSPTIVAANEHGVLTTTDIHDLAKMGAGLDLLFEVTGDPQVIKWLKHSFEVAGNKHTILVQDLLARLLVSFDSKMDTLLESYHPTDTAIGAKWDWKLFAT